MTLRLNPIWESATLPAKAWRRIRRRRRKWFREAAAQNLAEAEYNLGACYSRGEGVAEDCVEADKWLLLAARQGYEEAKKNITRLQNRMTPEQIAEGQKRARDFKPR